MKSTIRTLLRQCVVALGALLVLTVIVGVGYPAVVWGVSRINSTAAEGAFVTDARGCTTSDLLGIDQQVRAGAPDPFLHNRPSTVGNLGPNSPELVKLIDTRRAAIAVREGVPPEQVPTDAVTGSGSGMDPNISAAYANIQVPRIARVTGLTQQRVREVIAANTDGRQLGFLGTSRVNVQKVNRDLANATTRPSLYNCR
ncbi:MAG: potassium-transporting ATPase subunit C [Gordonia sp. (in: high G+C Gram-positive bacteria)]|uniref:potassium-transporting ATPase subunit C n=1 Tax=Gordonia sp. (in: high G+C Gram-positive bacteria) TaxID=84139 RepID=UPI003C7393EC